MIYNLTRIGRLNMIYSIALLNGLVSVVSPCIIFMIPLYVMYIQEGVIKKKTLIFIGLGIIFTLIGLGFVFRATVISLSYFMTYRHVIVMMIAVYALKELGIIKLPKIQLPLHNSKFSFVLGIMLALSWVPCISYFFFPITLASSSMSNIGSFILFLFYAIGLLIPLFLLTMMENHILKKIQDFSVQHQNKIKIGLFVVLIIVIVTTYFLYSNGCIDCINLF